MKWKNELGLPESIFHLITNRRYSLDGAEISVTGLLKPMRQLMLERRYFDEIEVDISTELWATYGSLMHELIAQQVANELKEQKLFIDVNGVRIVGHYDSYSYENKILSDYKFTSAWTYSLKNDDWEKQLNIYRLLLINSNYPVDKLQIIALFRDFSYSKAKQNSDYPKSPIEVISIETWPLQKTLIFLSERVSAYQDAMRELPLCTPEEKWQRNTIYAVMQPNRKTARRLFDNYEQAQELASMVKGAYVEKRAGFCTRCEYYCKVKNFCEQYQDEKRGVES